MAALTGETGSRVERLTLVLQDLMVVVCYKPVQASLLCYLETSSGTGSPVCHRKARKGVRGQKNQDKPQCFQQMREL